MKHIQGEQHKASADQLGSHVLRQTAIRFGGLQQLYRWAMKNDLVGGSVKYPRPSNHPAATVNP